MNPRRRMTSCYGVVAKNIRIERICRSRQDEDTALTDTGAGNMTSAFQHAVAVVRRCWSRAKSAEAESGAEAGTDPLILNLKKDTRYGVNGSAGAGPDSRT